jgi:RNA polymerase sigma-70 factor (ECF subfamily)
MTHPDPVAGDRTTADHHRVAVEAAIARVLAGDRDAFAVIVNACQDQVWRVIALLLDNRASTEDLVQASFVRAYDRLEQYTPGTDVTAWIITIARNLARNALRDRQRERKRLHHYHQSLLAQGGAIGPDEASAGDDDQPLRSALAACRSQLGPDAQAALRLVYQEDLAIREVASQLGRSDAATQKFLSRIRLALRDCVQRRLLDPAQAPEPGMP